MKQFVQEHLGKYLSVLNKDVISLNLSDSFQRPLKILFTSFFLLFLLSTGCFGQFTVFPVIEKDQLVLPDVLPDTLKLMVPAQGAIPPYGYQWQVSLDGGSSWSNIDGADTTFYRPGIINVRTQFVLRVIDADNPHRVTSSNIVTMTPISGGWIKNKGPLDNVPNLSGPQNICSGSSGNVYETDPGMTNYRWVVSAGGTKTAGGTTTDNTVTVTWNVAGAQAVQVRYNEATDTAKLKVIVHPLPTPVITGPSSVCAGSVGNVYSTAAGMSNYIWAVSSGGTITAGGTVTNNTVTVTWSTPGANTVSVIYTDLNNCTADTPTVYNVAVNPIPDAFAAPASQTICSGQSIINIILTGSIPGTLFSWTRDNTSTVTGIAASGSGNISGTMTNTTSSPVTVTFTITPSYNGCPGSPVTATVLVKPAPSVNPVSNVTYCHGATTTEISFSGPVSGTTYAWTNSNPAIGLPASGTGNIPSFTATNSGASALVANITVTPAANGCQGPSITFTITVNPINTITLTSGPGTTSQVVCNNTPVTNITYSTTGATGATFTGLPTGVTGTWMANVVTISGTPTATGTFPFTITLTGGCGNISASGTITVTPDNTITLTSPSGTDNQSVCVNTSMVVITYSTTGATGATITGLPAGVTGNWATDVVTIIGTPTATGTFPFTITLTGGCGNISASGTITVTPDNTITLTSPSGTDNQSVCINTSMVVISYSTTGATGATFTGLPTGVTGTWMANVVTISGTPTATGTFPFTITLTGGCGNISASGTITVTPDNTITLTSPSGTDNQSVCVNTSMVVITYSTTGATGATITGLPAGVTGNWATNVVTISGTPTATGTFPFTITLTGGCGNISASGTITVTPDNTITLTSPSGTDNQSVCINTSMVVISYSTTGASGATFTGLPTGVTGNWATNVVTISGTPTIAGPYTYTITLNGGCGNVTASGTITVNPTNTITLTSGSGTTSQVVCNNTPVTNITYSTTGATGATFTGLPTGVTGNWVANVVTISGTPTIAGTYTYNITLNGGCGMITAQGAITVNPLPTAGSIAGNQTICYNGDPLMINSEAAGTGPGTISYRWESSLTGGAPWTVIPGATGASYDPAGPMTATTWYRRITISTFNGIQCESDATNVVKITVQPLLSPGAIAASQTICYNTLPNNLTSPDNGGNPGGYGTPVWRWEYSTNGGVTWTVIPGATSSGYLFTGPLTQTTWYRRSSGYSYDGVVCYSLPTDPVIITVQSLVNAGTISPDRTICENDDPPAFSSTAASGDGSISYQWQSSVDGIIFTNIASATAEIYDPGILTSDRWYRRIAISTLNGVTCQAISNIVKITVINIGTAGTIAANQLLCPGESPAPFTSTAPAGGDGNITYQWQISLTGSGAGFSDIPGATSITYSPPASAVNTWYRRMAFFTINGVTCSIASGELYIYIVSFNPGTITPFNNDTIFCSGENPGLISGTPFVSPPPPPVITLTGYRWQSNTTGNPADFANIAGATGQNYDPPALTVTTWFRRVVDAGAQGKVCSAPGNIVTLRVFPTPTLSVTSPVTVCQGSPYTITATAGNTGIFPPSYTLHYVSGTYVTPPADTTNTTGIFILNPPVLPSPSPVGQQHFTVTVTNGDPGACSAVMPVTVEINDIPDITLTPSCSSTTGNGVITMTGVVTYPVGAVVEYRIMANPSGSWSAWQTNPLFTGLGIGSYTVEARNSLAPSCTVQLIGEILALTVGTVDYTICQNGTVPAGQGLIGNSYCITWANANANTGTECTDAAHTYVMSSSQYPPYTAGSLVQYAVYATVWAPLGVLTIKDCPNVPGRTYSIYVYPFDPLNPGQNFVRMVPNTCPGGSGWVIIPLDPNLTYQIILNSPDPATSVCTQVQFTTADKIQVAVSIAPVNWYQTPTSETIIHTGSPFNPYGTPYLPAGSCPGSYPFYAGCAAGLCREPAYFIINPRPIVTSVNDTICTGQYTDILLVSKDSCNNPVDPSKVTYEWTASVLSGSATGFSDCALNCGAVIHQQLFSTSTATCPVVRYLVRAKVGECYGSWYPVDVLIINIASITLPVPPANVSYACQGDVPPPEPLTAQHACLGTLTAQGVDTDNGGAGCPLNPLIITRTWTFVDACGTFAVSQIIRVSDSIPPTFTPPPDITVYTDESCSYSVNPLYTGTVTDESDNCSTGLEATYKDTITNGPCQGSRIITRTWSLTDNCGNTTTENQLITVMDSIPPAFTRPTDKSIPSDENCAYNISVTVTGDVTDETDNCSTGLQATFTDTFDETDPCHIIVSRTWHLVDDCGNAADDQVQTITVEDILPPTFTRPADITIYTDANCEYDASVGVTGDVTNEHDNCSTGLEATNTDTVFPGPCEGSHLIHRAWQLVDNCGNRAPNQVQIITVSDTTPPTFDRPADITIYADANCNYDATLAVTGDATNVRDNCSTGILPTYSDVINNGSCTGEKIIHRTWSLVDHCGNHAADQVQTITVLDTISPQFSSLPDTIRSFCVIDIITAIYYPDTMDISPVRPDYYILSDADKTSLDLDPSTYLDNCTPSSSMTVHWRIDFNGGTPPPITGTGLISGYPGEIRFEGAPNVEVTHSITYWLEDDCNNLSSEVKVWISVKPRPDVVKMTN